MKSNLLFNIPTQFAPDPDLLQYLPCHPDNLKRYDLKTPRPSGTVLYFLYNKEILVYVGKGKLYYNLSRHIKEGKVFDSYAYISNPSLEAAYIRAFKPNQNKYLKSSFSSYRRLYYMYRSGRQEVNQISICYPLLLF